MDEIECLDAEMFLKWVKEKNPDDFDEGIRIINENKINGHIFMSLTDRDLKDLFPEFMIRKRIRDLQITEQQKQQQNKEVEDANFSTPPPKKMKTTETITCVTPPACRNTESPASTNSSRNSPLLRVLTKCNSTLRTSDEDVHTVNIPLCGILANPTEHTEKEVDTARVKMIRLCMDSLISLCGDRPNELDIINLARSLASQYSILRDDSTKPAGNNYRAVKKFLERRMYNITPARTNRGRKRKNNEHVHEKEQGSTKEKLTETNATEEEVDTAEVPLVEVAESVIIIPTVEVAESVIIIPTEEIITEDKVLKTADISKKGVKTRAENRGILRKPDKISEELEKELDETRGGNSEKVPEQKKIEDRSAQSLDKELRRCSPKTTENKVEQLLRLTVEYRCSYATTLPKHSRVEDMIGTYPVFKSTDILITNLLATINLEGNIISHDMLVKNLKKMSTEILDLVYAKNLTSVPRSALKSEDQQILVAMAQLPLILVKRDKGKSVPVPHLVHIVKKDEMWQEIAAKHKNLTSPWIMYQRHGDQEIITVMIKQSIVKKASSAVNAVLALMGIYYMAMLPYPSNCSAALLYLQGQVLQDEVHSKDKSVFIKAKEIFENFAVKEIDLFA